MIERSLSREEIERVWEIDRAEVIDYLYYLVDGALVLRPEHYDMRGWPPGEIQPNILILRDCFDRGGWFYGIFDAGRLVAVAVLESRFIGADQDQLQLKFLHVSHGYRDRGLGTRLFALAQDEARGRGARRLYISATPSEHTINFYLGRGCTLCQEPDPELLALEPDDIHLEYELAP